MFSLFSVQAPAGAGRFYCYCAAILKAIKFYGRNSAKTHTVVGHAGPERLRMRIRAYAYSCVCACAVGVDIAIADTDTNEAYRVASSST